MLIAFIWIIYLDYFAPKPRPKSAKAPKASSEEVKGDASTVPADKVKVALNKDDKDLVPVLDVSEKDRGKARRLDVDTSLYSATVSSWGSGFVEFKLKKYKETHDKNSPLVDLFPDRDGIPYFPMWKFEIGGVEASDKGLYDVIESSGQKFVMQRRIGPDLILRKTLRCRDGSYMVDGKVELIETGAGNSYRVTPTVLLPVRYRRVHSSLFGARVTPKRGVALVGGKVLRFKFSDKDDFELKPVSDLAWGGVDDLYFLQAYLPRVSLPVAVGAVGLEKDVEKARKEGGLFALSMPFLERTVDSAHPAAIDFSLYMGPKDIHTLAAAGSGLEKAIDLGNWLGVIARPMLLFMKWIYKYVHNYGIAIILLTLVVRLLMNPLNKAQYRQMKKMQELQPEIKKLQEKYKGDKVKQQQETMALFRRHKVNPMGGCFPMLLQMPIFFALYRVLYNSIELRHAPFFLWINDLSARDPYYITPVLMGVAMYLQQKMTPTSGDASQQAMMKIMPIFFALIMAWLPSGLVLYILTSTVLGVWQQRKIMNAMKA